MTNGITSETNGNGTLTAEQVREAIERHTAWVIGNNRCFHDSAYEEIADELNAKLGGGTCTVTRIAEGGEEQEEETSNRGR